MRPTLRIWKAYVFQNPLSRTSFSHRLIGDAIIWGPPLLVAEMISSGTCPRPAELPGFLIGAVPFVLLNVAWFSVVEHFVCLYIKRRREQRQP
jgi:hypothetical protein